MQAPSPETLAAGKAYMAELQRASSRVRWAKWTPEARSAYMRQIALRQRSARKPAQGGGRLNRNALEALRREFEPVWQPSRLVKLRRALRMPQEHLGAIMSMPRQTVDRWERGVQVPNRAAQRLIWLLERMVRGKKTTLADLLTWADD